VFLLFLGQKTPLANFLGQKRVVSVNVQGLPQDWDFITVRPATKVDQKTDDEVNN